MGTFTTTVVDSSGKPVSGAAVHIDWSDAIGIGTGANDGVTDSNGVVSFEEGLSRINSAGAGKATKGLDFGKFSASTDILGNGSATVTITVNPLGILSDWVQSALWTILIIAIVILVLALAYKWVTGNSAISDLRAALHSGKKGAKSLYGRFNQGERE